MTPSAFRGEIPVIAPTRPLPRGRYEARCPPFLSLWWESNGTDSIESSFLSE